MAQDRGVYGAFRGSCGKIPTDIQRAFRGAPEGSMATDIAIGGHLRISISARPSVRVTHAERARRVLQRGAVLVVPGDDLVLVAGIDAAAVGRRDVTVRDLDEQVAARVLVDRAGAVGEPGDALRAGLVLERIGVGIQQRELADPAGRTRAVVGAVEI